VYSGNIHKTPDGRLFMLDFFTSCEDLSMYDHYTLMARQKKCFSTVTRKCSG